MRQFCSARLAAESHSSPAVRFVFLPVIATADTAAKIPEGTVAVRVVEGVVQNKYANDPGKLAAWFSAKHVERDPKKKAPPHSLKGVGI
jgi:hypothetical protein